jgi:hypothetical protein
MTKLAEIDLTVLDRVMGGQQRGGGIDFDKGADAAIKQTKDRAAVCRAIVKAAGPSPRAGTDQGALAKAGRACWASIGPS